MSAAVRRVSTSLLRLSGLSTAEPLSTPPIPASFRSSSFSSNSLTRLKFALRAESDPEKLLALFQSSTHLPRFYYERTLYQIAVGKLARSRRPDLVERLLESQKSDPSAPKSEGFFIRIMSLFTEASMPDHAARIFEQIPARTEHSLCALLTAYLKQGQYDRVRELFDRVPRESGIVAGVTTHNILLVALCENGEVDSARHLLDEMPEKKGLEPNIISYNTIMSYFLKKGDDAGFHDILEQINRKGIDHNVVTYNLRMADFCKRNESFKAEELLDLMVSKGIQPNLSTFNTLINGFCKEGNSVSAIKLFKMMKKMKRDNGKKSVSPSSDTYIMLLRCLVENREFASAEQICRECLMKGFAPPFEVMKALIIGLVKDTKVKEANDLAEKMRTVVKGDAAGSWTKLESELL